MLEGHSEHSVELCPVRHICLLEYGLCAARGERVFRYYCLCFWAESQICEDDIAALVQELDGEAEINAGACSGDDGRFASDVHSHCESREYGENVKMQTE